MDLEIHSYVGVGPIRFGMTLADVRRSLPAAVIQFAKGKESAHPTDAFDELGIHVFYRSDSTCEAVEMFAPAGPTLLGEPLLGMPFFAIEQLIKGADQLAETDESGVTSYLLGVAIYCPGHDENPRRAVEAVLAFKRGYYEAV